MRKSPARAKDRVTFAGSMALIALAAKMPSPANLKFIYMYSLNALWIVVFFLLQLLIRLARPEAAGESAAVASAMS